MSKHKKVAPEGAEVFSEDGERSVVLVPVGGIVLKCIQTGPVHPVRDSLTDDEYCGGRRRTLTGDGE